MFEISLLVAAMRPDRSSSAGPGRSATLRHSRLDRLPVDRGHVDAVLVATPEQPWWIAAYPVGWATRTERRTAELDVEARQPAQAPAMRRRISPEQPVERRGDCRRRYLFDQLQGFMQHIGPLSLVATNCPTFDLLYRRLDALGACIVAADDRRARRLELAVIYAVGDRRRPPPNSPAMIGEP